MHIDPDGKFYVEFLTFSICTLTIFAIFSTASQLHDFLEEPFVIDISFSKGKGLNVKAGVSFVFNLQEEYLEIYPHFGFAYGTAGFSVSIGTLDNYKGKGDYEGVFIYGEIGKFIGMNYCFEPDFSIHHTKRTQASAITYGNKVLAVGIDYYFHFDFLVFDWS
jgi:hypothetical protein